MAFTVKMGPKGSNLEAETSQEGEGSSGKLFTLLCLSHGVPSAMAPSASCSVSTVPLPVTILFLGLSSHSLQWHQVCPPPPPPCSIYPASLKRSDVCGASHRSIDLKSLTQQRVNSQLLLDDILMAACSLVRKMAAWWGGQKRTGAEHGLGRCLLRPWLVLLTSFAGSAGAIAGGRLLTSPVHVQPLEPPCSLAKSILSILLTPCRSLPD